LKRHEKRKDLAGEHVFGDLGQIILLVIFLAVWITDFFFVKYSTQFSEYAPLYIRIPLAIYLGAIPFYLSLLAVFFSTAAVFVWVVIILFYVYLCKHEERLLTEKFGSDYEQYKLETPMLLPEIIRRKNSV
jgi:hypothetical protein